MELAAINEKTPAVTGVFIFFVSPWHRMAPRMKSGGGGDRTRVPRHFHACFYVCIRLFEFSQIARLPTSLLSGDLETGFN